MHLVSARCTERGRGAFFPLFDRHESESPTLTSNDSVPNEVQCLVRWIDTLSITYGCLRYDNPCWRDLYTTSLWTYSIKLSQQPSTQVKLSNDQRVEGNALVPTTVATESEDRHGQWMVIYHPVVQVSIKGGWGKCDDNQMFFLRHRNTVLQIRTCDALRLNLWGCAVVDWTL